MLKRDGSYPGIGTVLGFLYCFLTEAGYIFAVIDDTV